MAIIKQPNVEPIPGYRLIAPLGRGGFGEVWKCEAPGGLFKAIKFVYGNLNGLDNNSGHAEEEHRRLDVLVDRERQHHEDHRAENCAAEAGDPGHRDRDEPEHVHIERDDRVAKFWLDPVRLQRSGGFGSGELNRIQRLVEDNREDLIRSWNEYFSR